MHRRDHLSYKLPIKHLIDRSRVRFRAIWSRSNRWPRRRAAFTRASCDPTLLDISETHLLETLFRTGPCSESCPEKWFGKHATLSCLSLAVRVFTPPSSSLRNAVRDITFPETVNALMMSGWIWGFFILTNQVINFNCVVRKSGV